MTKSIAQSLMFGVLISIVVGMGLIGFIDGVFDDYNTTSPVDYDHVGTISQDFNNLQGNMSSSLSDMSSLLGVSDAPTDKSFAEQIVGATWGIMTITFSFLSFPIAIITSISSMLGMPSWLLVMITLSLTILGIMMIIKYTTGREG